MKSSLLLSDAHTHLHLHPHPAAAQSRAVAVSPLVVCATEPEDFPAVLQLCRTNPAQLVASFGVHPWRAAAAGPPEAWLPSLEAHLDAAAAAGVRAAVGEIGLDRGPRCPGSGSADAWAAQVAAFTAQLRVAARRGVAASVHCVRAQPQLLAALAGAAPAGLPAGLLLHSWAGSPAQAARLRQLLGGRVLFSFAGCIVASACKALAERAAGGAGAGAGAPGGAGSDALASLRLLPAAEVCFETDAPDQPFLHNVSAEFAAMRDGGGGAAVGGGGGGGCGGGGGACCGNAADAGAVPPPRPPNEPALIGDVVLAGAILRGEDAACLAAAAAANLERMFGPAPG
jgi:TatD DNase family protein